MQRPSVGSGYFAYALILTLAGSIFSVGMSPTLFRASFASHENITIEMPDDVTDRYDPEDTVSIEGTIDDLVDNEDVTIKFKKPGGTTTSTEDVSPSSNGNFDFPYDLPASADDGVWTIEVEYDNDRSYTYFIVDDESDTITLETDNDSYGGGDEVEISGTVDDVVSGEDFVEITILDPTNDEILDSEDVDLGAGSGVDDDEFKYTFEDLATDADHGRYAVIVTYDGSNQEGSTLFEVTDDGGTSGSDNISADLDNDIYEAGDTVRLTGNINDVDSAVDLEILVENPDNDEIESDDSVDVETDGDFEFEFDLESDAKEGEYTITITYGTDELELTFDVGEDAGSAGTKITVKLNKSSFLAGESITVTGSVPRVVSDQEVSIIVYDKNSIFGGSLAYVVPNSDKTYSAVLRLESDLEVDEDYTVRANYDGEEARATFSITGQISGSDILTVKTDKPEYAPGSTVAISGKVAADSIEDKIVIIEVLNPEDRPYRIDHADVESDGSYSYELAVGGELGIGGVYEVKVTYNGEQSKTTFEIKGGTTSYDLKAAGQTFKIQYEITAGSIKSMFVDEDDKKLVVAVDATEDGQITLVLPREVISSVENGQDIPYVVANIDFEAGGDVSVSVDEGDPTSDARTLIIDYEQGTDLIEISGTSVVPEFSSFSIMVIAIAVVAIIVVTARFGVGANNKFGNSFFAWR